MDWTWLLPIVPTVALVIMAVNFVNSDQSDSPLAAGLALILSTLYLIPISVIWAVFFFVKWMVG